MAEQRYYWLKLKRDFFKRHDVTIIEGMPNGKDYVLFYLKLLCESVDHEGNLRFSESIPYNEEMLATITRTNIDIVRSAIQIFRQLDLIEVLDDGTLYMHEVQKMLGSETEWAEKKRIYREKQKQLPVGHTEDTPRTQKDNVRQDIDKEKDKEKVIDKEKPAEPSVFGIIPDADLRDDVKNALRELSKARTAMKAKMTPRAMQLMIGNLKKLSQDPETQTAIVNQSILNGWKGDYPRKQEKGPAKQTGKFYTFEEHPHTEQSDEQLEAMLLRKQREKRR